MIGALRVWIDGTENDTRSAISVEVEYEDNFESYTVTIAITAQALLEALAALVDQGISAGAPFFMVDEMIYASLEVDTEHAETALRTLQDRVTRVVVDIAAQRR